MKSLYNRDNDEDNDEDNDQDNDEDNDTAYWWKLLQVVSYQYIQIDWDSLHSMITW